MVGWYTETATAEVVVIAETVALYIKTAKGVFEVIVEVIGTVINFITSNLS